MELFGSRDLDLDRMTSYTNLSRIPVRHTGRAKMKFLHQCYALRSNRITDIQTDRQN